MEAANVDVDKPIGYGAFGVVWSVKDPRDGRRVALKKIPNVFHNVVTAKRVLRELKILCFVNHENILSAVDLLQPTERPFDEMYVMTPLMHTDLHKIIVSQQPLTEDHVKLFLYQILRGMKYLHAAKILHRDVKPGNLLVNSDCRLKICDFGLARVEEPDASKYMTQEVVTQYYRAPELLMGARHYTSAIDVWSVGCIFAELLSRKILFQANSPVTQIDMIISLLGERNTTSTEHYIPHPSQQYSSNTQPTTAMRVPANRTSSPENFYLVAPNMTHEAAHLLSRLLVWNPKKRVSCAEALRHVYCRNGRLRYHTSLCLCCHLSGIGTDGRQSLRVATEVELEPVPSSTFNDSYENVLKTTDQIRSSIAQFVNSQPCGRKVPLCINTESSVFSKFMASTVAHSHANTSSSPYVQ
ncbi:serine/threonine-protein kinase NLK-like [Styela clava]|uniref:serine/threonine-protein kinase NLK-like n=1 Tax=Styela clava TaxID=7725 RepID=UPI0019392CB1|nr:serine/threonine-protein kinase NLK-like [Styela clava]